MGSLTVESSETSPSLAAIVAAVEPDDAIRRQQTSPEGVVTIAFTDIVGSTEMMESLGEPRWLELMFEHNRIVQQSVAEHGGDVVKSAGDGYMIVFASTGAALGWAITLQRTLAEYNRAHPSAPLGVRIGLNAGNVFQADDDLLGRAVVLAARITGQAAGSQILVSAACREYTRHQTVWRFILPEDLQLKGLNTLERVYTLDWR